MLRFATKKSAMTTLFFLVMSVGFLEMVALGADGDLSHYRLANGLELFVKEDHSRKVAAIQIWVKVGSAYETDAQRGISHVIEHMAFKGTKTRGVGKIAEEVEEIGGEINAYTSWDETVFHIVVPSSVASRGLDILTDAVFRPLIDPKELEKEKKVVIEEILEGEDRPEDVAFRLLLKTAYQTSPYRYPIIGSREIVEKITRQNILDFRKKWYVPENMFVLVVGDVNPSEIRKEVEKFTIDLKPKGFLKAPLPPESPQEQTRSAMIRDPKARETRLDMAFHIPSMKGADVNALDLTADILGAREDSRLVTLLKKDKGLVNSITAYALTLKETGLMVISATLPGKNLETVTRTVMEELARLRETPPSLDELQQAQIHIESEQVYARETVQGVAKSMGTYQNDLDDAEYVEKYLILNSAVTPEQVSDAVKKYLVPSNATVTALLAPGEAEGFHVETLEQIVMKFAETPKPETESPTASRALFRELNNGMKVVLVPDNSNPVISFRIACLGGKRFETPDTQGIMNFIARMLTQGAGNMTEFEIARKVDTMGGMLEGFSGYDSVGLFGSFFSRYANEALELLSQLYTDPTFPQDKVDRERELIVNSIRTEADEPSQYVINLLNRTLFPDFPYGFDQLGTLATVSGFTREDLKDKYHRFAVPNNTVLVGVGHMDPQEVFDRISQLFGQMQKGELEKPSILAETPLEKVNEAVERIPRAKAHLAIGFRGPRISDPDRYPLDVLNNLLAAQGGPLFLHLRDEESLAYVVTSFFRPGLAAGVLGFYMACDAPKVDRAFEGLVEQIERIKKTGLKDAELKKSINNLIGNHLISQQSSGARAEEIGLNTLYGLGYDYDRAYIAKIREVTADDVLRVARTYLDLKRCAIVKILPEEEEGRANTN